MAAGATPVSGDLEDRAIYDVAFALIVVGVSTIPAIIASSWVGDPLAVQDPHDDGWRMTRRLPMPARVKARRTGRTYGFTVEEVRFILWTRNLRASVSGGGNCRKRSVGARPVGPPDGVQPEARLARILYLFSPLRPLRTADHMDWRPPSVRIDSTAGSKDKRLDTCPMPGVVSPSRNGLPRTCWSDCPRGRGEDGVWWSKPRPRTRHRTGEGSAPIGWFDSDLVVQQIREPEMDFHGLGPG